MQIFLHEDITDIDISTPQLLPFGILNNSSCKPMTADVKNGINELLYVAFQCLQGH